jgi:7-cyano-7-deazaguanine synthase
MEFDSIAYAVHTGDHTIYPDCRETFIAPMQEAFKHANWHPIEIYRPFLTLAKADIVRLGYDLDVPLELTYSCYEGDRIHCGECGACVERKEAFVLAGIPDPTQYKK